jgi:hypothetical protein
MPRKARIDAPGALHHIIVRGIERKTIFKDSIDYSNIIDRSALKALRSKSLRIMGDERILGSSEFVESVLKVNEDYERKTLARRKGFNSEIATTISANPFRWIF